MTSGGLSPFAVRRSPLPAARIVAASYATLLADPAQFLRRVGPWYGAIAALALLRIVLGAGAGFDQPLQRMFDHAWTGIGFVGGALFALRWNRTILLRQGVDREVSSGRRTVRFLLVLLGLAAGASAFGTAVVALLALVGPRDAFPEALLGFVLVLGLVFAAGRTLPALALAALDYPGWSLVAACRLTRGHGLRLFLALVAVLAPAVLARSLCVFLAWASSDPATDIVLRLAASGFTFVAVALGTGFGACAYIALARRPD